MRALLALTAAAFAVAAPVAAIAQDQTVLSPSQTLLEIQADGTSYAAPDTATITGGVLSFASTSRAAAEANAREMDVVVQALRDAGIAARDIQTQNVSLNPQFNYNRGDGVPPEITGYQAQNSVTVRVRDLDQAGELLTTMFEAGANNVYGPSFSLINDSTAVAEARAAAVAEAKAEADAYAAAFGMRVVKVLRISERQRSQSYEPIIVTGVRSSDIGAPPPPPPPPPAARVQVGEMQQRVTLFVDYVLESR